MQTLSNNFFSLGPTCGACGLHNNAEKKCMAAKGSFAATFAFISDHPEKKDVKKGEIWSDRKTDWALDQAGISISECYFTSLIKCSVSDPDKINDEHVSACLYYLLQELAVVKPRVIFVTGKRAFMTLTKVPLRGGLGTARGASYPINLGWGECHVIPTWKPGFADFKVSAANDVVADLLSGRAIVSPPRKTNYRWVNDPAELIDVVDMIVDKRKNRALRYGAVALDTETTNKVQKGWPMAAYLPANNIGTIQIGWDNGEAIAVPVVRNDSVFNNPFNMKVLVAQMHRILSTVPVVGQNYKYDELYFRTKLGLSTRFFMFDTMLANHFMFCGSMPNDLGFMVSRHLGWRSHKRDIEAALAAMPDEERSYGALPQKVVTDYGCGDVDGTLQLFAWLRQKMREEDYSRYRKETTIVYDNMLTAFMERTMGPWRAITDMEFAGALVDTEVLPEVTAELKQRMDEAFERISSTPPYMVWLTDHTTDNPKRRKYKKKSAYKIVCSACNTETPTTDNKAKQCPVCRSVASVKRFMQNTDEFVVNYDEPETVTKHINLNSPSQVSDFFYNPRYLGLQQIPKMEGSTDKTARAEHIRLCDKAGKVVHVQVLEAIGEYAKASKLYTAYATKLSDYMMVTEESGYKSGQATSEFEVCTGVNYVHTNVKQNGTYSGRLCFSENTRILTDRGELRVADLLSDGSLPYHVYTHKGNWKRISHVIYKGREQLFRIETRDGVIECTRGHRLWFEGWVSAGELIDSFRLRGHGQRNNVAEDHFVLRVTDLGVQDVWDISVEDDHSFYAQGMFHHNSTVKPSLHVIPRTSRIKSLFVSRFGKDGLIGQADLAQAEVRGFVIETGDENLRDAFINGEDPYVKTAAEVLRLTVVSEEVRQDFKSVILGILYGRGAAAVAEQTKRQVDYIKSVISQFFSSKPKIPLWVNARHDFAHKHRCTITRFGRIRPLIDELAVDDFGMINHAENVAINHPIQGMVGDIGIDSVSRIHYRLRREGFRSLVFNTVHDSIIVDIYVPEVLGVLQIIWEELYEKLPFYFPWINVPFTIDLDIGPSWGQKAGVKMDGRTLQLSAPPATIGSVLERLKLHFSSMAMGDDMSFDEQKGKLKVKVTL